MLTVIITGSGGLIGSESVQHYVEAGYDVVGLDNDMRARFFGSSASTAHATKRLLRFGQGGRTHDYPRLKLVLNRVVNAGIRFLFQHGYNDTTNAFKAYRRYVIDQLQPLLSKHFNMTIELPLKAIVGGYNYAVLPVSWTNRRHGVSKLKLQEMGSRYLFVILYFWLEAHLSRGDYRRQDLPPEVREDTLDREFSRNV